MTLRSCSCGQHHRRDERCPRAAARRSARDASRGSSTQRGYDHRWRRLSALVIAEEGQCRRCGHPGSPDNPLTTDHITPKARGGTDQRSNLQCLCRWCNTAKAARLA